MRPRTTDGRRLSGRQITVIAVAACATLAPTAVYAAERVISVIGDPHNSSALARVSEDGRLGVRGEATSQQGVPGNEWHTFRQITLEEFTLLKEAPPGSGIGLSRVSVTHSRRATLAAVNVYGITRPGGCPDSIPYPSLSLSVRNDTLHHASFPAAQPSTTEYVYPVPATVPPSPTGHACLYARGGLIGTEDSLREIFIGANGVSGRATPAFAAPKGDPFSQEGEEKTEVPQ